MSQLSTATTIARRARDTQAPRRELHVVRAADATGSPWFAVLVVAVLLAGLGAVLALNTKMAQDSFEVSRLEARSAALADTRESLVHDVNERSAPQHLARRATQLGMVPADSAAFVDLRKGTVLGVAKAAEKPEGFSVDAAARPIGDSSASTGGSAASSTTKAKSSTRPSATSTKKASSTTTSSTTSSSDG